MTTRPTDQELQAELAKVVKEHNDANDIVQRCKMRYAEIQAVLKDRGVPPEEPAAESTT
jgi:hypothetical protein